MLLQSGNREWDQKDDIQVWSIGEWVAVSVFTHLHEQLHGQYLRELRRIATPMFIPYDDATTAEPYGSAFVLKDYIEREWRDPFQLAVFHAAPDDWQDYSVLIRKPA